MIIFQNVQKSFGDNQVLADLNLTIDAGEFLFLLGESGVGKSTLLHVLVGAETLDAGRVLIDQIDIGGLSEHTLQLYRRRVGMVFQDYKLLPKRTVYENVRFALEATDTNPVEMPALIMKVLAEVGLSHKAEAFPEELSGGEKQRAAIARALVHNPNLIIADEPTGNLDARNSEEIIDLLERINRNREVTVIVATHDLHIVNRLKKRIVEIHDGKVVRDERR
jgi:cell division transport system ATP-binding protein